MRRPALLALTLLPLLGACRYNFVPLIPAGNNAPLRLPVRITGATLTREDKTLVLRATLSGSFKPGYLRVDWFNDAKALGQDSTYLDGQQTGATFTLLAPDKGAYRATLSFGGDVLRQVELYEIQP